MTRLHQGDSDKPSRGRKQAMTRAALVRLSSSTKHKTKVPARGEGTISPTPQALAAAEDFFRHKWAERAASLNRERPSDLTGACKFASAFAALVFGGTVRGNWHHQWVEHSEAPGGRIDLTHAEGVLPHDRRCVLAGCRQGRIDRHDARFFGNKDHKSDMASVAPRAQRWAQEFLASQP